VDNTAMDIEETARLIVMLAANANRNCPNPLEEGNA